MAPKRKPPALHLAEPVHTMQAAQPAVNEAAWASDSSHSSPSSRSSPSSTDSSPSTTPTFLTSKPPFLDTSDSDRDDADTDMSTELLVLEQLRKSMQANLRLRPIKLGSQDDTEDSPLSAYFTAREPSTSKAPFMRTPAHEPRPDPPPSPLPTMTSTIVSSVSSFHRPPPPRSKSYERLSRRTSSQTLAVPTPPPDRHRPPIKRKSSDLPKLDTGRANIHSPTYEVVAASPMASVDESSGYLSPETAFFTPPGTPRPWTAKTARPEDGAGSFPPSPTEGSRRAVRKTPSELLRIATPSRRADSDADLAKSPVPMQAAFEEALTVTHQDTFLFSPPGTSSSSSFLNSDLTLPNSIPDGDTSLPTMMSDFTVSTILPSFLFLGPEPTLPEHVEYLRELGVRRILNLAIECNANDHDLRLDHSDVFERYHRIPMRDIVEEVDVRKGVREACSILDDARLHSSPTYVHCKVGKSRSVTAVIAYLIHANHWTLSRAYSFVLERRRGISPNIGFVSELMGFEEEELGGRSLGVSGAGGESGIGMARERNVRESMPASLCCPPLAGASSGIVSAGPAIGGAHCVGYEEEDGDSDAPRPPMNVAAHIKVGEMEVKDASGRYRHARRAPVDETTLQPLRRVSKAGLESAYG